MGKYSAFIPNAPHFQARQGDTQWPTLRGGRFSEGQFEEIRHALSSLVFIKGEYETNLNAYWNKPATEQFAMWESEAHVLVKNENLRIGKGKAARIDPKGRDQRRILYLLCWVGNYHYGSIFHCGWQFPHVVAYDHTDLMRKAGDIFYTVANIAYNRTEDETWDADVVKFIKNSRKHLYGSK